jgi:glyoxylase-like metal-dependent hydrolase (beta-lactamase superfamily II)
MLAVATSSVNRIRLGNTVFEGANNAYVLQGETVALVDTGIGTPPVERDLRDGLAEFGLSFADVDEVFLTHWHEDHSGLAAEIQAESDATVRAHEADAPLIEGDERAIEAQLDRRERLFDEWGIPDGPRAELEAFLRDAPTQAETFPDVVPFEDGERFQAGDRELEVLHLPGHAAGLCGFAFADDAGPEVFSGDAVLPKYTPNVGGADTRVESPLAAYVDSLQRFVERDFDRAWPGHRDPIDEPTARALTILDHHRERTANVVDVLADHGPADAWTVSSHLFGDLENIHILHGPGEAYAHLDHLASAGVVERDGTSYHLVDTDPDVDALFPTIGSPDERRH